MKSCDMLVIKLFCSSHVGSGSYCCVGPGFGGLLPLLCFQEMLWEKEKAKESTGEEDRPPQEDEGRGGRTWRKGELENDLCIIQCVLTV